MYVRFWGTRGSIAKPGASTLRYGGNTSCVEVCADDGTRVVIDCGTGAHELARALMRDPRSAGGYLLVSHTHWDHIQGFPLFDPLFVSGQRWEIYAPGGRAQHLEASLAGQMSYDYHPVGLEALEATYRFHDLTEGQFDVGGIRVTTQYLNHPALTLGYRLEADGAVVVYSSDHEPHAIRPAKDRPGLQPVHREDQRHVRFLQDADLVIHDAQYTLDEYARRAGWGHTPYECAVDYAIAAKAQRLALYHHDPLRSDPELDEVVGHARSLAASGQHVPEVMAAAEGRTIELPRRTPVPQPAIEARASALISALPERAPSVLIVEADPKAARGLQEALKPEQIRLLLAADEQEALAMARDLRPSLIFLRLGQESKAGCGFCSSLRHDRDPHVADIPIVVLTDLRRDSEHIAQAFQAGATDYLSEPIKSTLIRSRVRSWLLRTRTT
ncbi:MAG: response regulator [Betaproteobacteria bacterium]|nr:response regulator [Betaproteobacteria bacterium]